MKPKNAFYAQSGGVTAVINASAAGVIETARKHKNRIGKVYAGRDGIIGALTEDLIDTSREQASAISRLKTTPGGAFGSCRYKLKGIDENRAHYERLIDVFRAHDIGYFFYNGGNDSADTAWKISQVGEKLGYPLVCVGIPKTVDNDLAVTDNCPASARWRSTSRPRSARRASTSPRWRRPQPGSSSWRSWAVTRDGSPRLAVSRPTGRATRRRSCFFRRSSSTRRSSSRA